MQCKSIGCKNAPSPGNDFCQACEYKQHNQTDIAGQFDIAQRYPEQFKDVSDLDDIDIYQIHALFNLSDASGCLHHASRTLLLSGSKEANSSLYKEIQEARDALTRWLQINAYLSMA